MHHLTAAGLGASYPKHYKSSRSSVISHHSHQSSNEEGTKQTSRVVINVSGEVYETLESTLNKYPETILGTPEKRLLLLNNLKDEIFINRHRTSFEAILFYFQSSGNLVRPASISMNDFEEECLYYRIAESAIKRMKQRDCYLYKRRKIIPPKEKYSTFKHNCWTFFDSPRSFTNYGSVIYFVFSFTLILVSIGVFCVETELILNYTGVELEKHVEKGYRIELTLNIFFALELLTRFYVSPERKRFFQKPVNAVEALSISTYLILYGCPRNIVWSSFLKFSRVLRAIRLTRLSKISKPLRVASSVFQVSIDDVFALCFVTIIICILCGSIMYYIEMDISGTKFTSIPASMWWAMQSVVCLGYGDIVPTSIIGKAVGSLVLFFGVVTVTVLLLSLGGRFFDMYSKELNEKGFLPEDDKDYEIHYK